jgi:(1->4)-alpha-D-glucan 1-alpha-D-glucosylmutase
MIPPAARKLHPTGLMYRVPRSTYRLQFNAHFKFADAARIADYLAALGISDVYASPILKARKGSPHGYDVVDPASLNPELGTDDDFNALHAELERRNLGFLLDVVPNHMAASDENAWWMSVLENGPQSRFLHYFDVEWQPKILLPILGRPYGEALESREICVSFDAEGFFFRYYDKRLPLAPQSYKLVLRDCVDSLPEDGVAIELRELVESDENVANSRFVKETIWRIYEQDAGFRDALDRTIERMNEDVDALDALLDAQWYRLAYWRIASEKINYRRFFDVTDLVGVRVENPEVFEARNRRTLELIAEGKVTGLRIDHIDGLHDPVSHMRKLQARIGEDFYIVLEKILTHGETLRDDFPVAGTSGYDFLDSLNTVFVDPSGLRRLDAFYRAFTGCEESFSDVCYSRKKRVIAELFSGEMRALGKQLAALALADRNARDFAPSELLAALTEITACLRVYRTYVRDEKISDADEQTIRAAIDEARKRDTTSLDHRLFTFLEHVLLVDPPRYAHAEREKWLAFVMRWQQFTGRVMAKGVEDTALYVYNRLVSMNEVGGHPGRCQFDGLAEFHARSREQQRRWPHTMNATSTHDTKRSEDVRARINVLSEIPDAWEREVRRWSELNAHLRKDGIPDANEELLIYQTLCGMWPVGAPERLRQYVEKAAREAKTHTSWITPDGVYEEALLRFSDAILQNDAFMQEFLRFHEELAFYGAINSLAQVVLKTTAPGVPDFYQGTELWDFSLVDPDNRRPVDYDARRTLLHRLKPLLHMSSNGAPASAGGLSDLLANWRDGRVKLFITAKTLAFRAENEALFRDGDYEPLDAGENVCAFMRGDHVLVVVPRFCTRLVKPGMFPIGESVWRDAVLNVSGSWKNIYTAESVSGDSLALKEVFATFPVAVLKRA